MERVQPTLSVGLGSEWECQKKKPLGPEEWLFRNSQGTSLSKAKYCKGPGMIIHEVGVGVGVSVSLSGELGEVPGNPAEIWASLGHGGPWGLGGAGLCELDAASQGSSAPPMPAPFKGCLGPTLWGSAS